MSVTYQDLMDGETVIINGEDLTTAVAVELGRAPESFSTLERSQLDKWFSDITALVKAGNGGTLDGINLDMLKLVITELVVDRLTGPPPGALSEQVTVDDATSIVRFSNGGRAGLRFTISSDMWGLLKPQAAVAAGAFSISPSYAPDTTYGWRHAW